MFVRQSLVDGSYTLYSVAIGVTRNGVTILNTTSIRAQNEQEAKTGAMRITQETYAYPGATYAVAVAPIDLEMFT